MQILLDFNGRRRQGERPFAVFEAKTDHWHFSAHPDSQQSPPIAQQTGQGQVLLALRWALAQAKEVSETGAALGFFAYDFARTQTPQAFSRPAPPDLLKLPDVRLVFFEELLETTLETGETKPQPEPDSLSASGSAPAEYTEAIHRIHDRIRAGDLRQANYAQQFSKPLPCPPAKLYERLHCAHAAPFSAFLEWDDFAIVSNSPERFLKLEGQTLIAQPIKGTTPRGSTFAEDAALKAQLQASEKNRKENLITVELLRDEFELVCEPGSVDVPQLFELQTFPTLHHLVSTVQGTLRADCDALDAFAATFPCASISGVPKLCAMQLIDELEGNRRGASFGCIGYFGFQGDMEWNVAIRTVTCKDGQAHFHAGGGITAASEAASEYAEMQLKAKALLTALR